MIVKDKAVKEDIFDVSFGIMLDRDVYISPKVLTEAEVEDLKKTGFMEEIAPEMQVYG